MLGKPFRCSRCGGKVAFVSSVKNPFDILLFLFLLRPVRCDDCYHRQYRSLFSAFQKRPIP